MKQIFTILTFAGVLFSSSLQGSILSELNANNDHGIWISQTANFQLSSDWSIRYRMEQRLGSNYKKVWYYQYEAVFLYNLLKLLPCNRLNTLTIGLGYNITMDLKKNTLGNFHWVWINRPIIEANISFNLYEWSIRQRLRGEYNEYSKKHYIDHYIYRQRLAIYTPWKFTCLDLNPFISNEWFFRKTTYSSSNPTGLVGGYHTNRFRIGFDASFTESLGATFSWQWRASKKKPGIHPGWFYTYQYCIDLYTNF